MRIRGGQFNQILNGYIQIYRKLPLIITGDTLKKPDGMLLVTAHRSSCLFSILNLMNKTWYIAKILLKNQIIQIIFFLNQLFLLLQYDKLNSLNLLKLSYRIVTKYIGFNVKKPYELLQETSHLIFETLPDVTERDFPVYIYYVKCFSRIKMISYF